MLGRHRPDSVKEQLRIKHTGKTLSLEHRKKLSESHLGHAPPNKGKPLPQWWKDKLSLAQKIAHEAGVYDSETWRNGRKSAGLKLRGRKQTKESIAKRILAVVGKPRESMYKAYPKLVNIATGETIEGGVGIDALCQKRGFERGEMSRLLNGKKKQYKEWVIYVR